MGGGGGEPWQMEGGSKCKNGLLEDYQEESFKDKERSSLEKKTNPDYFCGSL